MSMSGLDGILYDFHTISGMDISVVDRDFHTLALARSEGETLCTLLHRSTSATDKCKESDIERLTSVKNSNSPLLYVCPFGIIETIVPVIRDEETIGYVIAALGIKEGDESDVLDLCKNVDQLDDSLSSALKRSRTLTEKELSAYFNMVKILARHIANDPSLIDRNESIGQLIKKYVKNNLGRKLTLSDIARSLHCSTVTLTEHFKKEFGITINDYITKKRMDLAESLLISTDDPLREIASVCGFSDVEYFSRTFKKYHEASPAAWRREKGK